MNGLREMTQFVGGGLHGLRAIGGLLTPPHTPISMRAALQRLKNLPPITLEASIDKTQGEAPLDCTVDVNVSPGVVIETRGRILSSSRAVLWEWIWSGPSTTYDFANPGSYFYEVERSGVTSTGHTVLTKDFAVTVRPHPAPPPPPPPQPVAPSIAVQANGEGSFVITGSGFLANATVHIRVVDDALTTVFFDQSANAQGVLNYRTGKICRFPGALHISANDGRSNPHDLTGTLWSNTVTTTCS